MSKHDKIAKLKEYIKNIVIKELEKDEELDEVSTTATAGIDGTGTGHYDTPHAFASGSIGHKNPEVVGYKKVNEGYGEMMDELEKIYRPTGAPPIAKEALKDLADEYDIGRVLYAARTNRKSFMEVMDMKIDQLQAQYVNKKHINTIKRGKNLKEALTPKGVNQFKKSIKLLVQYVNQLDREIKKPKGKRNDQEIINLIQVGYATFDVWSKLLKDKSINEVVKKEVDAVNKVLNNLKKLRQDYSKIMKIGDKTLSRRNFNKYWEAILNAEQEITKLHQTLKGHLIAGFDESINEGRYHDWRNDESMTPKQKIGISVREVRDALNELDKRIKMNLRLKTELNVDSRTYWKNTHKALNKISERLVKLANKVGSMK